MFHNRTYVNELHDLPSSAVKALSSIHNVSIHTLPVPALVLRPEWDLEGDWFADYIGFSSMSRAIWMSKLGKCHNTVSITCMIMMILR
jgi:hypothetical protein